jgi:PKD repeat protein
MRNSHIIFLLILLLIPLVLPATVSATTFYLNNTTSDLSGGADWNRVLLTQTSVNSIVSASIQRSSTETQYAWTNSTMPNNTAWEAGAFTVKVNVTALGSTSYLWLNVQVDHVNSAGNVIESSATSTEQQMTSTGVKTFSIASKTWTDGASTDRLRLRYIMRNSRSNADYAFTISQGDLNSYVNGSVTTNHRHTPPVASFTSDVTSGAAPLDVQFNDTSTNTPSAWNWSFKNVTGNNTEVWFSSGATQNVSYTFGVGNWSIRLNASNDGGGNISTQVKYINVSAAAIPLVADFTPNATSGVSPAAILFTDTSTGSPTGWTWLFGDEDWTADPWVITNTSSGWIKRSAGATVALPDGSVLMIGGASTGGSPAFNDTWRSIDNGTSWNRVNASGGWLPRYGLMAVTAADGSVILTGGVNDGTSVYFNDTWRSTDKGSTWTRMNASSGWQPRYWHRTVAMGDGSVVLLGGTGSATYNETWRTTDYGATWVRQNASSGWQSRYRFGAVTLSDNSIVLVGGNGAAQRNDTWRSTDYGVTWTNITGSPSGWIARYSPTVVAMQDDSIILVAGYNDAVGALKDAWKSTDKGITWTLLNSSVNPTGFTYSSGAVTTDGTFILTNIYDDASGDTNRTLRFNPTGSTLQNPTHTYSASGNYSIVLLIHNSNGENQTVPKTHWVNLTGIPVASFTASTTNGAAPLLVTFTDISTNSPTAWNWSFQNVTGNNTQVWFSTSQNPSYTFGIGNWSIKLNASASGGSSISAQITYINVTPPAPTASFISNVTSGAISLPVQFNDTSTGLPTGWMWLFGDENWTQDPWITANSSSGWIKRSAGATVALPDGSVLMIGGASTGGTPSFNDTWRSTNNGTSWNRVNASGGWLPRYGLMAVTAADGSVILTGGYNGDTSTYYNDVWRTTDKGSTWTRMTGNAEWTTRYWHRTVAMADGSIVLMGGDTLNDTWRSTDYGATWLLQSSSSGWQPRYRFGAVTLSDNSIILFGGTGAANRNDTWRSTDYGATWTNITGSSPGWAARYSPTGLVMPDDSILLIAGTNGATSYKDAWRSIDKGITWTLINSSVHPYAFTYSSGAVTTDGTVILTNVYDENVGDTNITYRFNPTGSTIQNATHTYSTIGNYSVVLLARNAYGDNSTRPGTYYVNTTAVSALPPTASFNQNVTSGTVSTDVLFTDTSTGSPTGWSWFFGDENYTQDAWVRQNTSGGWLARQSPITVTLSDGSLLTMSGSDGVSVYYNDTWRSTDKGVTWVRQNASSGWIGRQGATGVALSDGSAIIMSGQITGGGMSNDTWRTTDKGVTWVRQNASSGWAQRYFSKSVELSDDSIIIMGGYDNNVVTTFNDTWRSTDKGVTWTRVNASSGWGIRRNFEAVALPDDSIVLFGGRNQSTGIVYNDTWRSTDKGVTWVKQSVNAVWINLYGMTGVTMPDNSIVFLGGTDGSSTQANVYRSTDKGVTWSLINTTGISYRYISSSTVLPDGSMIVVGGVASGSVLMNDTWRFNPTGSTTQNPTHTYTSSGNYSIVLVASNVNGYNQTVPNTHWVNVTAASTTVVASFNQNVTSGTVSTDVLFTDTSTGSPTSWRWYFGDENWTQDPWTIVNSSSGFEARKFASMVTLTDGSVLIFGGWDEASTRYNDTWRSTNNGSTWVRQNASSGWIKRQGATGVALPDGSVLLIGGSDGSNFINDTWRSTDKGVTWTKVNNSGSWEPRAFLTSSTMSDGSVVIMGGVGWNGADQFFNDTWRSTNQGSTWTRMNASSGWLARCYLSSSPLPDGSIVMVGGVPAWGTYMNDTWRSTDNGATWTRVNATGWTKRGGASMSTMPDGSILVVAGEVEAETRDIVWRSTDKGSTWNQINSSFDGDVGIYGLAMTVSGDGSVVLTRTNASYRFNPYSSTSQSPTHTYSSVGNYSITLRVNNTGGFDDSALYTHWVNVTAAGGPVASFSQNVTSGTAPTDVAFTDTSTGSPTGWSWFFGDENYTQDAWIQQNSSSGWGQRENPGLTTLLDGSILLVGGDNGTSLYYNDTWRSTDKGVTWTRQNASAFSTGGRFNPSLVTLSDGSVVVYGGQVNGNPTNETWRSTDKGVTWTLINASSGWQPRFHAPSTILSDDTIIVTGGGYDGSSVSYNDTWKSTDKGYTWTRVNASSGWEKRRNAMSSVLPDDSIMVYGGKNSSAASAKYYNDVWRSTDKGSTWTRVNASSGWTARATFVGNTMLDGSIFLLGGGNYTNSMTDQWKSTDKGVTWLLVNTTIMSTTLTYASSTVLPDGSMIIVGGYQGATLNNITWRFQPSGAITQNPTHTYSAVGNYSITLSAYNANGDNQTAPYTHWVNITSSVAAPIASFTSNVTSETAPLPVQFNDTSTGSPTSWNWSYYNGLNIIAPEAANGTESGTASPLFSSTVGAMADTNSTTAWQGSRSVRVNTTGSGSNEGATAGSGAMFPLLSNTPYTASFYLQGQSGGESVTVRFTEYDNSGYVTATNNAVTLTTGWRRYNVTGTTSSTTTKGYLSVLTTGTSSYVWFIDGIQFEMGSVSTPWQLPATTSPTYFSTSQNASYTFSQPGNFTVTLNATNSGGSNLTSGKYWINVSSSGTIPIVSFTLNKNYLRTPSPIIGTNTSTCNPACTNWNWSWGDGTYSTAQTPTHIYLERGKFLIALNVTNSVGYNLSASQTVRVTGYETYA